MLLNIFDAKLWFAPWPVTLALVVGVPVALYFMISYYKKNKKE